MTRYVGLPANQTGLSGGAPTGLPGDPYQLRLGSDRIQSMVLTNPSMSDFLIWNDGISQVSDAPYVWSADGSLLDRWPTNLAAVPPGIYPPGAGASVTTAPGGEHALDCLPAGAPNVCPGDVNASSDLSHFVFASEWNVFAPGGQLTAPGSVYDNDTADRHRSCRIQDPRR